MICGGLSISLSPPQSQEYMYQAEPLPSGSFLMPSYTLPGYLLRRRYSRKTVWQEEVLLMFQGKIFADHFIPIFIDNRFFFLLPFEFLLQS